MKLISPTEYVQDAARQVNRAKNRVSVIAMVIADHPATHELIAALERAAERGIDVTVSADVFTYGEVNGGFLPLRYYSPNAKLATKMAKKLKKAGVTFHWLGRTRATLLNGRTHSKWCVVDNLVYSFGGVNLYEGGVSNIDYMFKLTDASLADQLVAEQLRIVQAERGAINYPSVSITSAHGTVHFDGGIIGRSAIYRRACDLASQASSALFVSQYCPTGKLARLLKRTDTNFYFNRPEQAISFNRLLIRLSMAISGIGTGYKHSRYLHAKFIIFTMPDGSKVALTGSHNFAYTGVLLGTREIALETSNPGVISQLQTFHRRHIR